MAEYRAIRVEKGSGGFGGPLTIQGTEQKNKVMYITGGGMAPEILDKIVELSGTIENCIEMRRIRKHDSVVNGCQALIEENLSNPQFSLSVLAEHFGITQQTLRRRFKETTGQTLSSYLTARRIELAKTLLSETNLSMNEICVKCGYIDVSSFTKLFKSEVGISPGAYRETHSEIE